MEQYITPDRIANAIMQDNSYMGHYLIVEGAKDVKFFQKYVDQNSFRIREALGYEKVLSVLKILDERGFNKKIGIIDSDFSEILQNTEKIDGLYLTDDHDIEVMIIKTKALYNVIHLFCSHIKVKTWEESKGITIRDIIFELGRKIGYLKLANKVHGLGLVFRPLKPEGNQISYRDFIDEKTMEFVGTNKMIETIMNYSRNKSQTMKSKGEIEEKLNRISQINYNRHHLTNGHDLTNILYILMKKTLSSRNKMLVDFNSVEDSLILAYEFDDFKQTNLYQQLNTWAIHNGLVLFR